MRRRRLSEDEAKAELESKVAQIARAMAAVVDLVQTYPEVLTEKRLRNIERFAHKHTGDMMRALGIVHATPKVGDFSLDDDLPENLVPTAMPGILDLKTGAPVSVAAPAVLPPQPGMPRPRAEGRLVGTKEVVTTYAPPETGDPNLDDDNGVGFLDD